MSFTVRLAARGLGGTGGRLGVARSALGRRVSVQDWRDALRRCGTKAAVEAPRPTPVQLRRLFVASAVPFVAFGIVDQTVLIYAGDAIDATVGVRFGLPTLAAAAFGQVLSDTTGVLAGGTIDALATKLGLPLPGLSLAQQHLVIVKRVATLGSVCGVITGCFIGMLNLLVVDMAAIERAKRAEELKVVMKIFVEDGRQVLGCARASLWAVDDAKHEFWSSLCLGEGAANVLRVSIDAPSIVGWVYHNKQLANIHDVRNDPRWHRSQGSSFAPTTMVCAPVISSEGRVLAVVQLIDKLDETGNIIPFCHNDELMVRMLAGHARIVMEV